LIQLLDQKCGGLIFDIKGSFGKVVKKFADKLDRELTVIGVDKQAMNLLEGLSPETAAKYLRAAISIHGVGSGKDAHWLESAADLAESVFGMLHFMPKYYTLRGVHDFIYNADFRKEARKEISELKLENEEDQRLLKHYSDNYDHAFEGRYKEYKDSVLGTIDKVLKRFSHPKLTDSFCAVGEGTKMPNMSDVLNGKVFLVDMPLERWGMSGNVVYMFLKLRYFGVVKDRLENNDVNKSTPVFFMCDEYQRLIDRSSSQLNADFNFWDKSREAKNIGIISSQSISSFYSAIGDKTIANAILQNFRQKICLKTEDQETIQYFEHLLGTGEGSKRSYSQSEGHNKGDKYSTENKGESESLTYVKESVVDAQMLRLLKPDHALACLSIDRQSMDDVIELYV
jgi:type IV secretory pathway TraG/TraD family ATPase VirD4